MKEIEKGIDATRFSDWNVKVKYEQSLRDIFEDILTIQFKCDRCGNAIQITERYLPKDAYGDHFVRLNDSITSAELDKCKSCGCTMMPIKFPEDLNFLPMEMIKLLREIQALRFHQDIQKKDKYGRIE